MKKRLARIALVLGEVLPIPNVQGGAIEELVTILAEQNEIYRKVRFDVFCTDNQEAANISKKWEYTKVHYIKHGYLPFRIVNFVSKRIRHKNMFPDGYYYPHIFSLLRHGKYDYIVAEGGKYEKFSALKDTYPLEKMCVHVHHHLLATEDNCGDNFGRVIAVSEFVRNEFIQSGEPRQYVSTTIKNCVRTERFLTPTIKITEDELRKRLEIADDDFIVMYCGRFIPEKGVLELIEAIISCPDPKIKLLLIGSTNYARTDKWEYEQEIEKVTQEHPEKIIRTGYIPNDELPSYYQLTNVQVVPSLWEEAAGLVTIEAMLSGVPLIITQSGGMVEYVSNECAIKIRKDDKEQLIIDLKKAIEFLYANPAVRNQMAKAGVEHGKLYSPKKFYSDFVGYFMSKEQ